MRLRRALCLCVGLSSAACGDVIPEVTLPSTPLPGVGRDASLDGSAVGPTTNPPGGGTVDAGSDASAVSSGVRARTARIVSMAPSYVVAGDSYQYAAKTVTKARSFELVDAPAGMTVRNGLVRWDPSEAQSGTHRVTLRALGDGDSVAEQQLVINVSKSTLRASDDVDDTGGSVFATAADAPRVLGLGVLVPPRSVASTTRLSISELDQAPAVPNSAGSTRAVRFGPSGQVFDTPAQVTLALPADVTPVRSRLGMYVYNPVGRWDRVPMVSLDVDNGLVSAKAQHFSIYAAIQSSLDMDVTLMPASDATACAGGLVGRMLVSSPLSAIELSSVNNLSDAVRGLVSQSAASVQDLLSAPGFTGSLRAVQVYELMEGHEGSELLRARDLTVTTLYVPGDGTATITHTDELGNVLGVKQYARPMLELGDIAMRLRGSASGATFGVQAGASLGLAGRVHLAYFPGDSSLDAVSVDDLGMAAVERAPTFGALAAAAGGDVDCDGLLDDFDATNNSMVAAIEASPSEVTSAFVGDTIKLGARVARGTASSETWTLIDVEGASLAVDPSMAQVRSFQASAAGRYLVSYSAVVTGRTLQHVFAIDVAERATDSVLPSCHPSKALDIGRVGEPVALSAIVGAEGGATSALQVQWGLVDKSVTPQTFNTAGTLQEYGAKALFAPTAEGIYTVGCRSFDGKANGPVGQVDLTVLARDKNRAPTDLSLSPSVANIAPGAQLTLHAAATDPDGDKLTFAWAVEGASADQPTSNLGESTLVLHAGDAPSTVTVMVEISDGVTTPVQLSAKILVGKPAMSGVDADMDGWFAGTGPAADCNDQDAKVHPQAQELCGSTVDINCDGVLPPSDCDGDGFTVMMGDCDDSNPSRHPGAKEICDGLDDDCNGVVDENKYVGLQCKVGIGECVAAGVQACAADGSMLCAAKPLPPMQEVCDQLDNNCDGMVDEGGVCTTAGMPNDAGLSDAGVPYDAGSTTTEAGVMDASLPYDAGVATNYDGAAPTGCTYTGAEVCTDGIDNDCDGFIDGQDLDCQQKPVVGDNCGNVPVLLPNTYLDGSFDGAKLDFASSCGSKAVVDVVYAFKMDVSGSVMVGFQGAMPYDWSIQTGTCDPQAVRLSELMCGSDTNARDLAAGAYFLVLQGVSGPYKVALQVK